MAKGVYAMTVGDYFVPAAALASLSCLPLAAHSRLQCQPRARKCLRHQSQFTVTLSQVLLLVLWL